jgi:hypothetical protein
MRVKHNQVTVIIRDFGKVDLIDMFCTNNCKAGAEVGIYNGEFSQALLRSVKNLTLYMIDPYKHWPDGIYEDRVNDCQEIQDARCDLVKLIASKYDNRAQFLRMTSIKALGYIPDNSLDFVYIDANHEHEFIEQDIKGWHKKVKKGGVVSGHDFSDEFYGVKLAVTEFCNRNNIKYMKHGRSDDVWFFVKGAE